MSGWHSQRQNAAEEFRWWYDGFEYALKDAGYKELADMPFHKGFDEFSDEGRKADETIRVMYDAGLSPEEAVVEFESPDFWVHWT